MGWEKLAKYCGDVYGVQVDMEDRFFICPYCGEPLYEADWSYVDLHWSPEYDKYMTHKMFCPICEETLWEGDEDE